MHLKLTKYIAENVECTASAPSATSSDNIARVVKSKSTRMTRRPIKRVTVKKITESEQFDPSHVSSVMSKLDSVVNAKPEVETKSFGFEDTDGNIIKVVVSADDADNFKQALSTELEQLEADGKNIEVAELLFKMRNKFNIVDVKWPQAVEDEEPLKQPEDGDLGDVPVDNNQPSNGDPMSQASMPPPPSGDSNMTSSAMDAMLQALIADAEARRQEAVAKAAEARAREAAAAAEMSRQKLSAEEEVADMEAFYSSQNEEQKEAKKLAKLAKFRHQMRKSQQQLRSTAYDDALDDQDDDNMMGIDTAERDPSGAPTGDDTQLATGVQNSKVDGVEDDPTATIDSEVKSKEMEEVEMIRPVPDKKNLLRALRAFGAK